MEAGGSAAVEGAAHAFCYVQTGGTTGTMNGWAPGAAAARTSPSVMIALLPSRFGLDAQPAKGTASA